MNHGPLDFPLTVRANVVPLGAHQINLVNLFAPKASMKIIGVSHDVELKKSHPGSDDEALGSSDA